MRRTATVLAATVALGIALGAGLALIWPPVPALLVLIGLAALAALGWAARSYPRSAAPGGDEPEQLLERAAEHGRGQERLWREFTWELRSRLANIRAAVETLEAFPMLDEVPRKRLQKTILEESEALSESVDTTTRQFAAARDGDWQLMRVRDRALLSQISAALESELGIRTSSELPEPSVWVRADAGSLVAALTEFISELKRDFGVDAIKLRLREEEGFATLDLIWSHEGVDVESLCSWQEEVLSAPDDGPDPALKAVARRHGGESWFNLDRSTETAYVRILVPVSGESRA